MRNAVNSITIDKIWYEKLSSYCATKNIDFMSTPTYEKAVDELLEVGVKAFKIASMDLTNIPFLRYVASKKKPIILSRGMGSLLDITSALEALNYPEFKDIALLHCIADYPAKAEQLNLKQIKTLTEALGIPIGYSDHTESTIIPSVAVNLGACIIEKHFTDDRSQEGFDHFYAIDPEMLKTMIEGIRDSEKAIGESVIQVDKNELTNKLQWQRSIVASKDIEIGEVLNEENLTTKRPGSGLSPLMWDSLQGRTAVRKIAKDQLLSKSDFS